MSNIPIPIESPTYALLRKAIADVEKHNAQASVENFLSILELIVPKVKLDEKMARLLGRVVSVVIFGHQIYETQHFFTVLTPAWEEAEKQIHCSINHDRRHILMHVGASFLDATEIKLLNEHEEITLSKVRLLIDGPFRSYMSPGGIV